MPYYVVGGEYSDTTFKRLVRPEPASGPFASRAEAYDHWRARAFATMDFALVRFSIEYREDVAAA